MARTTVDKDSIAQYVAAKQQEWKTKQPRDDSWGERGWADFTLGVQTALIDLYFDLVAHEDEGE